MIRLIAVLALVMVGLAADSKPAKSQCTGNFPSNSVCGNAAATNAQPKPTPLSSFGGGGGGGGGGGAANITRAQIPTTNLNGVTSITVNGYLVANDAGYGATYITSGATCPSGLEAIKDINNNCFNLLITDTVKPGWFGAKADDGATTISAGDVSANTQWRGTYTAGQTWDYVGTQEAVYAAFAGASTPGSISWNSVNSTFNLNKVFFIPCGTYGLNATVTAVVQGFTIRGAGRQCALYDWTGTSSNETAWLFNSGAYGLVENFSVQCKVAQSYGSQNPCISLDSTGSPGGLLTQQLTFINLWVSVGNNGQGFAVNKVAGGGGQGDTITLINPYLAGDALSSDYGILLNGSNTLQFTILGGDCQGFVHQCILDNGGVHYQYGFHFEDQNSDGGFFFAPVLNQIVTAGADVNNTGGNSGNGSIYIANARSEAEILTQNTVGSIADVYNGKVTETDFGNSWFSNDDFAPGYTLLEGVTNPRVFVLVDNGGSCQQWCPITSSTSSSITDSTASYGTNALVGQVIWRRFGSNGFLDRMCIVTSNTATTINFTVGGSCTATSSQNMYMLAGRTNNGPAPNWDGASAGLRAQVSVATHAGSNCIELGSGFLTTNQWIIIPYADQVAPATGAVWPNALYAQVTGTSGAACSWGGSGPSATLNRNAGRSVSTNNGYPVLQVFYGTGLSDGAATWLQVPYNSLTNVGNVVNFSTAHGTIAPGGPGAFLDITSGNLLAQPFDLGNGNNVSPSSGKQFIANYIPGTFNLWGCGLNAAATIDITNCAASSSVINLTPTSATTLNAPATALNQILIVVITTSGTTDYAVTFGTNFSSTGVLHTGSVNNKVYVVTFMATGGAWTEISRSGAPAAGTNAVVSAPAGPNSLVAATMQGLAGTITPVRTGNISITISGHVISANTAAGDGITNQISYGTGTAPTTNAALTGTQVGGVQEYMLPTTVTAADVFAPFSLTVTVTGLTIGTAYWIDLASEAIAHTGLANKNVNIAVHEF